MTKEQYFEWLMQTTRIGNRRSVEIERVKVTSGIDLRKIAQNDEIIELLKKIEEKLK